MGGEGGNGIPHTGGQMSLRKGRDTDSIVTGEKKKDRTVTDMIVCEFGWGKIKASVSSGCNL